MSEGDVRRVGVVQQIEATGTSPELIAQTLQTGAFTLDFMDDPAYGVFASYTGETFEELAARTGLPWSLLVAVREVTGSPAPAPDDRVREDEMAIIPLLQFQFAHGFRPVTLERNLRVIGDSLRRIAETGGGPWRSEVLDPLFGSNMTANEIGVASAEVSEGMSELDERASWPSIAPSRSMSGWPTSSAGSRSRWPGPD